MNFEQREQFLAGAHIALLSVIESHERAPLITPVWCGYEPGDMLRFSTGTDHRSLEAVRKENRAALTVHEDLVPYRCVSVEGAVLVYEPTDPGELRRWTACCLGDRIGERYFRSVEDAIETMTTVVLRPQRWQTYDFMPRGH